MREGYEAFKFSSQWAVTNIYSVWWLWKKSRTFSFISKPFHFSFTTSRICTFLQIKITARKCWSTAICTSVTAVKAYLFDRDLWFHCGPLYFDLKYFQKWLPQFLRQLRLKFFRKTRKPLIFSHSRSETVIFILVLRQQTYPFTSLLRVNLAAKH